MKQVPGQLALFSSPETVTTWSGTGSTPIVQYPQFSETWEQIGALCDVCGTACTSSKQCTEVAAADECWCGCGGSDEP